MACVPAAAQGISKVAVVGTGVIGASWTSLFLSKGLKVVATDVAPDAERKLRDYVKTAWGSLSRLDPQAGNFEDRIRNLQYTTRIEDHLADVDYVQENGPEKMAYKESIFSLLDRKAPAHAVLASSSSGLPSSKYLAKCASTGDRVLVGHPFNPPHLIPLVEIVPHPRTSQETIDRAFSFYTSLDRRPIKLNTEAPGFVTNRLQAALVHEAYSLVSRGLVSAADIDVAVSNALALRWAIQGPFLTKVLGGGGGKEGFKNHLQHVGHAAGEWLADMRSHAFQPNQESHQRLIESVDQELEMLGDSAVHSLPQVRDDFLVKVLRLKDSQKV